VIADRQCLWGSPPSESSWRAVRKNYDHDRILLCLLSSFFFFFFFLLCFSFSFFFLSLFLSFSLDFFPFVCGRVSKIDALRFSRRDGRVQDRNRGTFRRRPSKTSIDAFDKIIIPFPSLLIILLPRGSDIYTYIYVCVY